ncbi:hypothetical protein STEG23_036193 [Scotinomys teguina]
MAESGRHQRAAKEARRESTGAPPGQPDELLDSVDHHASIQQLSSEYFSLASPSDAEALYETPSGEKGLTDHNSSDHESSEHAAREHVSGEHTSEHSSEHSSGEHMSGEHMTGEHTSGEHTSGEHTSSDHTSGEPADQLGEQSSEVASAEQVSSEKAEEPGEQTSEATSSENNEQAMSTPFPSTSAGVTMNCHTCAYMNDDGKCLRGEGVCTTQNSQQCMLKKIFEGGKLQFMVQGCENMCPSMNLFSHGTRMQIICCRNEPLCNKI